MRPLTMENLLSKQKRRFIKPPIQSSSQCPIVHASVDEFLNIVVKLIPSINKFFDEVLVMAEDEALRSNRLALVGQIANLSSGIADLSKLEGF